MQIHAAVRSDDHLVSSHHDFAPLTNLHRMDSVLLAGVDYYWGALAGRQAATKRRCRQSRWRCRGPQAFPRKCVMLDINRRNLTCTAAFTAAFTEAHKSAPCAQKMGLAGNWRAPSKLSRHSLGRLGPHAAFSVLRCQSQPGGRGIARLREFSKAAP